jgi:hypothetical protein
LTRPACRYYAFLPALRLAVCGDVAALRHFDHEYGRRAIDDPPDGIEVSIQFVGDRRPGIRPLAARGSGRGGHKSVRWEVVLSGPSERPLQAAISLLGWPRSFGLSLVQGYFVEALLSLAAPRTGHILLPAAAIDSDDGPVLILGPSGAGKTSLSARAIARCCSIPQVGAPHFRDACVSTPISARPPLRRFARYRVQSVVCFEPEASSID